MTRRDATRRDATRRDATRLPSGSHGRLPTIRRKHAHDALPRPDAIPSTTHLAVRGLHEPAGHEDSSRWVWPCADVRARRGREEGNLSNVPGLLQRQELVAIGLKMWSWVTAAPEARLGEAASLAHGRLWAMRESRWRSGLVWTRPLGAEGSRVEWLPARRFKICGFARRGREEGDLSNAPGQELFPPPSLHLPPGILPLARPEFGPMG